MVNFMTTKRIRSPENANDKPHWTADTIRGLALDHMRTSVDSGVATGVAQYRLPFGYVQIHGVRDQQGFGRIAVHRGCTTPGLAGARIGRQEAGGRINDLNIEGHRCDLRTARASVLAILAA